MTAYGARGDGRTDDSVAVAAAVTALLSSATGGVLLFPAGEWLLNAPPSTTGATAYIQLDHVQPNVEIVITGDTSKNSLILWNATSAPLISIQDSADSNQFTITAFDVQMMPMAHSQPPPTNPGIVIATAYNVACENLQLRSDHSLGCWIDVSHASNISVSNVVLNAAVVEGVRLHDVDGVVIDHLRLSRLFSSAAVAYDASVGIPSDIGTGVHVTAPFNNVFVNNTLIIAAAQAILLDASSSKATALVADDAANSITVQQSQLLNCVSTIAVQTDVQLSVQQCTFSTAHTSDASARSDNQRWPTSSRVSTS